MTNPKRISKLTAKAAAAKAGKSKPKSTKKTKQAAKTKAAKGPNFTPAEDNAFLNRMAAFETLSSSVGACKTSRSW